MSMHARIVDGVVAELIPDELGGVPLADRFHPAFVAGLMPVAGDVRPGDLWDGEAFAPAPVLEPGPRYIPAPVLRERLEAQGKWDEVVALLTLPQVLKLATLREGVATDDAEMLALLEAASVDVGAVLAGFV